MDPEKMSCHEVGEWLETIELGCYKPYFVENNINGARLQELTHEILIQLGMTKLGHRLRVLRNIRILFV